MSSNPKPETDRQSSGIRAGGVLGIVLGIATAIGLTALINAIIFYKTPPLRSPLGGGAVRYWPTEQGDVFYKKGGSGPPLLLVHGIGAGCSSSEFRYVWDALARDHTVYALDLLGFGKSDKPDIVYNAQTYRDLLTGFAREVMGVGDGGVTADVIATSLSAAYVVAVAHQEPLLFGRLVLICPTGMEELTEPVSPLGRATRALLKTPVLGTAIYNGIAGRAGIRSYLIKRVYADEKRVNAELIDQFHIAAHQPGGERVLPSFVTGFLNQDIRDAYPALSSVPLVVWGREAVQSPVANADAFIRANGDTHLEIVDNAGMLPHEEQPAAFLRVVAPFLAAPEVPVAKPKRAAKTTSTA